MRKQFCPKVACAAIAFAGVVYCSFATADAADWGTLKGQVLLDGAIPSLKPLLSKGDATAKDAAVCAALDVPDEKLVVDPESKGIANVVVYLPKKPATIHPDLAASKNKEVKFDQKGCRFFPHVLLIRTDQQIRVLSDDSVAHNTHSNTRKNKEENFIIPGVDREGILMKPLKLAEDRPQPVKCDIHSFMSAWWVILDHPYAAITDEKGHFEIPDLPVGSHTFMVWQEESGWLEKKYNVEIKPGMNEQKPLKYTAAQIIK